MLPTLGFIAAFFALLLAFVLGRHEPSAVRPLVLAAGAVFLLAVGLAVWGEARWSGCYRNGTFGYFRTTGPFNARENFQPSERCPDKVLGLRSPFTF